MSPKPKSLLDTPWQEWPEWAIDSLKERIAIMIHDGKLDESDARLMAAWQVEKERIERERNNVPA